MRQQRWIEWFNDYDYEIRYHPGKANVVADAFSEASKVENATAEILHGLDQQMEKKEDGGFILLTEDGIPLIGNVRIIIIDETRASSYTKRLQDEKLARIYIDEIVARQGVPESIISDCDGRSTSRFLQTLQKR
ncbi:hypothetical protein Tco_0304382 [Tanacetum coccineum]